MSVHKLPSIEVDDIKLMSDKDVAAALTMDAHLEKAAEEKGRKWNRPARELQNGSLVDKAKWKLLGGPTDDTPLSSYVGLKSDVRRQMYHRIGRAAGTGMNAARTLKKGGRRIKKSKRTRKTRRSV